jgi:hypothetical protein
MAAGRERRAGGFLVWIGMVFTDDDLFNHYGAITGY